MAGLLERVPFDRVIVAIDPGKAVNRVWVTAADGLVGEPVSLPTSHEGIDRIAGLLDGCQAPVFAIEATGSLHRAWAAEFERRWPGDGGHGILPAGGHRISPVAAMRSPH